MKAHPGVVLHTNWTQIHAKTSEKTHGQTQITVISHFVTQNSSYVPSLMMLMPLSKSSVHVIINS